MTQRFDGGGRGKGSGTGREKGRKNHYTLKGIVNGSWRRKEEQKAKG